MLTKKIISLLLGCALVLGRPAYSQAPASLPEPQEPEPQEIVTIKAEVKSLIAAQKYPEALALLKQTIMEQEAKVGPETLLVAGLWAVLGETYLQQQIDYNAAIKASQKALTIREKQLGTEHILVSNSLNNLATGHLRQENNKEALSLFERCLAIREKLLGKENALVASTLQNVGVVLVNLGKYRQAKEYYQQSLAIREKLFGPDHPEVARSLNNLAALYQVQGDYSQALITNQRVLAIREKAFGLEHPDVARSLNNLAIIFGNLGRYDQKERVLQRALAIWEKTYGLEHPEVARTLNTLAALYQDQERYSESETISKRILSIQEKSFGSEHPRVAETLKNLGNLEIYQGRPTQGKALILRAIAIWEKSNGPEFFEIAISLNSLAEAAYFEGDYLQSERYYEQARTLWEKTLSPQSREIGRWYAGQAHAELQRKQGVLALANLQRSIAIEETNIKSILEIGSEQQKLTYLEQLSSTSNSIIYFGLQPLSSQQANALALKTILQRKGRILDTFSNTLSVLRSKLTAQEQGTLTEWTERRATMANLVIRGVKPDTPALYKSKLNQLTEQIEQLEDILSRRSADFKQEVTPVTVETVQKKLPADTTLVEFIQYRPFNLKATRPSEQFGPPRYAAYLLNAQGRIQGVDLGSAQLIDRAIMAHKSALQNTDFLQVRRQLEQTSRLVDQLVMAPVRKHLGNTRRLLIAPDGALNVVPFTALLDEKKRYLIERYSFNYVSTGRDLLRLKDKTPLTNPPLIVANPDFSATGTENISSATRGTRSTSLQQMQYNLLPGTLVEAQQIAKIIPTAQLFTGRAATETILKEVHSPLLLHIATHGFFLRSTDTLENPLLRSGLALAGFNQRQSGTEDGVLTALEVTGMDLQNTQLVVLSACETGLGDIQKGEGVYGLRRALVLAGSQSQVISLWKVDDRATQNLMVNYYRNLRQGVGRAEALRQAQLQLLKTAKYRQPYFWAAFIPSGDERPLNFKVGSGK